MAKFSELLTPRPYKFLLGDIDAFRTRKAHGVSSAVQSTISPMGEDNTFNSIGLRFSLQLIAGDSLLYGPIDVSKVFLAVCGASVSTATIKVSYRGFYEDSNTWHTTRLITLPTSGEGLIQILSVPYNVYFIKIEILSGNTTVSGLYSYNYFEASPTIQPQNDFISTCAFEFEINPATWSQSHGGGTLVSSLTGAMHSQPIAYGTSSINLHFEFLRGINSTDAYNFKYNVEDEDKLIGIVSHADKYKIEYFAQKQSELLLVTDEYLDTSESTSAGRFGLPCRITPGSVKFTRNLFKNGLYEYQESYSCDLSLTLFKEAV